MQNKARGRTDVQWVVSSVSLAVTMGLWGLFASQEKKGAGVAAEAVIAPPPQEQVLVPQPQMLAPGQVLLFGGTAPQPQVQQQVIVTQSQGRTKRGGGGGATTSTGSSKPKP